MIRPFPKTIILRHRKENLRKCTLTGLETHKDFLFYTYPKDAIQPASSYITLSFEGPTLSINDRDKGIFLIDGTWRYAEIMVKKHAMHLETRSLPKNIKTAYPRRQDDCQDPSRGLASIEALYVTHLILGKSADYLLEGYYFKDEFLKRNEAFFSTLK